jgi:hypothetical protein
MLRAKPPLKRLSIHPHGNEISFEALLQRVGRFVGRKAFKRTPGNGAHSCFKDDIGHGADATLERQSIKSDFPGV